MTKHDIQLVEKNEKIALLIEEAALKGTRRAERYPERKFFGYFCSYWPEELVLAAGLEPLRILPPSARGTPAELPAYCCSLARVSLFMSNTGSFQDLAGVGFAHTCDTMQCLGGIWAGTTQNNTTPVIVPVILNAPGAKKYYAAELESLLLQLGQLAGSEPGDAELNRALELCSRIRSLATELDGLRDKLPSPLVPALLRASQVMPRDVYAGTLEEAMPALRNQAREQPDRQRVLLSGAVLENDSLYEMIEELGGRVVADDTCTGFRHFAAAPEAEIPGAPLEKIVSRYMTMPPCPCRNRGGE
ncbi:2-hydroxyacyl-CoA dehydratase family protein [Desulfoscipio geothermicus]|uniref:Benzoyl-CoA reductase/2-hydroxyglutaryl-CoA dehydratase subunit, BcrC/BadD/HgdB n=1 Tax=Desulfoscipio geothermicus DSM 3669 TaxID=1121426 RepID=A0A1I6D621_9FIRM|nr:Benzoyl-CoA reductase/2-hydroxyglutaryl-CoA dehydratase subunit, BcrC/BadD/HgdB [Desulfoscipio geothermicus DSM 3669]